MAVINAREGIPSAHSEMIDKRHGVVMSPTSKPPVVPSIKSPKQDTSTRRRNRSRSPNPSPTTRQSKPCSPSSRRRSSSRQRKITRNALKPPLSPVNSKRPSLQTFLEDDSTKKISQSVGSSPISKGKQRPQLRRASIHQGLPTSTPTKSRRNCSRRPSLKKFLKNQEDTRWTTGSSTADSEDFSFETLSWPEASICKPRRVTRSVTSLNPSRRYVNTDRSIASAPGPLPFSSQDSPNQEKTSSRGGKGIDDSRFNPFHDQNMKIREAPIIPRSSWGKSSFPDDSLALQDAVEAVQQQALALLETSYALNLSFRRLEESKRNQELYLRKRF